MKTDSQGFGKRRRRSLMRRLDLRWLRLLMALDSWVGRCTEAHYRREKRRRFRRHLARQRPELN